MSNTRVAVAQALNTLAAAYLADYRAYLADPTLADRSAYADPVAWVKDQMVADGVYDCVLDAVRRLSK